MSIVVMADGLGSAALAEALGSADRPAGWPVDVEETERGAAAVVGAPTGRSGHWLVAGAPVRQPWGVPSTPFCCQALAEDFCRYGPAAVQLAAGPFVALNTSEGTVVRSLGGMVPLYTSAGEGWVVSTSKRLVGALGSDPAALVAPGAAASPDGSRLAMGPLTPEPGGHPLPWRWVQQSVQQRVADLGAVSRLPGEPDVWVASKDREAALYLPSLDALAQGRDALAAYEAMRQNLPDLWWRARLAGRWLFAPGFERPVLDTLGMIRSAAAPA